MRASYLQPSSLQYSSFLKEGGSKAGSFHFNEKFSVLIGHHCILKPRFKSLTDIKRNPSDPFWRNGYPRSRNTSLTERSLSCSALNHKLHWGGWTSRPPLAALGPAVQFQPTLTMDRPWTTRSGTSLRLRGVWEGGRPGKV